MNRFLFFSIFLISPLFAGKDPAALRSLYNSLDPLSLSQHLAFYELYPESKEGKKALSRSWELLHAEKSESQELKLPPFDIQSIVALVNRQSSDAPVVLSEKELGTIERIAKHLSNRKVKGHLVWSKEEVLALPSNEIDLARGLLLFQFDCDQDCKEKIRQYEASLDLMALQILVRLPEHATPYDKIREINRFIFQEMQFRFPPHSLHAKDIDLYTFLPSVLDSRQGVCLGVSILYLCLSQRLELDLEIITPPGHIYVRHREGDHIVNIETTARGIDLPSDVYLGINTRYLQQRSLKEVIGLAFFNQASVAWGKQDYPVTVALYEKAALFLPEDPLLHLFQGINYLFIGEKAKGRKLLEKIRGKPFDYAVSPETIPEDYLLGKIDINGLKAVLLPVDETRESILEKQKEIEKILSKYPHFRAGIFQLGVTYLQLGRNSEALEVLERYHKLDSTDPTVEYYLSMIALSRLDYNNAWRHLKCSEELTLKRNHSPKALKGLKNHLRCLCPES